MAIRHVVSVVAIILLLLASCMQQRGRSVEWDPVFDETTQQYHLPVGASVAGLTEEEQTEQEMRRIMVFLLFVVTLAVPLGVAEFLAVPIETPFQNSMKWRAV